MKLLLIIFVFLLNLYFGLDKTNKSRQFNMFVAGVGFATIIKLIFNP